MIKRYKILAENQGRSLAGVGSQVAFRVDPEDGTLPDQFITITITAVDPDWGPVAHGPRYARFEGYFKEDPNGVAHAVLGYHLVGMTAATFIGRLEIQSEDD